MGDNKRLNDTLTELWNKGMSAPEIASRLGISVNAVHKRKQRLGLENHSGRHSSFLDNPEKRKWFIRNYPDMSNQIIATYLGMSGDWLAKVARKLGLRKSKEYVSDIRKSIYQNQNVNRDRNGKFKKQ